MRRYVRLALVPLLLLAVSCSRDPKIQSQKLLENGNKFFDKSKFKEASIIYRRALAKDPKNGEAYYRLGLTSIKLQDYGNAIQALRRAMDIATEQHKDNSDAAAKLADIYWMGYYSALAQPNASRTTTAGFRTEVEVLSAGLLKHDPKSFDGLRLQGYLQLDDARTRKIDHDDEGSRKALKDALESFEGAHAVRPDDPQLCLVLVSALQGNDRPDEAETLARNFIAKNKTFAPMYAVLLRSYLGTKRDADAEKLLQDEVHNIPGQDGPRFQLAGFYLLKQRRPEMENVFRDMVSDTKNFPLAHLRVGQFFTQSRDLDRARHEFEAGISATPKEKAIYQKEIVKLLAFEGKFVEAGALVNEILKADPKDSTAMEMRAALAVRSGDSQQISTAVNDLQSLVSKSPTNGPLQLELGRALLAKGLPDQARPHLEEALRREPRLLEAKLLLAQIFSQKGDAAKGLQYADEIISAQPRNFAAHLIRTASLMNLGQRDKAKTELEAMVKAAPNSADAQYQLGVLDLAEHNYKDAELVFRQLRETVPSDVRGLYGIVESAVAQKNYTAAIQLVEQELRKDPNRQDFRLSLAMVLTRAGQYDEAVKQFLVLVSKDPKSPDYESNLAETYRLKGDFNNSIAHFQKAIDLAPNDVRPLVRMAMLLDSLGRRTESRPKYEKVIRLQPDNGIALNNLAFIMAEEGADLDQALSYAQRAKQKYPQSPDVSDTLGWIYIKKNLSDDAVRVLRELVTKNPANSTYRLHLAMALLQKGDRPTARRECETALKSNPTKEEQAKIKDLMAKLS